MYHADMDKKQLESMIGNMKDAGCSGADIERVRNLYEAGFEAEIVKCLRRCRCDLIDELHSSQRKVDSIDRLIRSAEKSI